MFVRDIDDLRDRIRSDPTLHGLYEGVLRAADRSLNSEPMPRELVGVYGTMLHVARDYLRQVLRLSFAYLMTREARYLHRAESHMLAAADFSDWNPCHFLDAAEMLTAMAVGYDWLGRDLSDDTRRRVREAIVRKGIEPSFELQTTGSRVIEAGTWSVCDANNWTQVCHAGLVTAALAIREAEPDLAEAVIARAVAYMPRAMDAIYSPCGAFAEGPMYWGYGTTFNVMLIDALQSVLGYDFELSNCVGFWKTADYQQHVTGPTGLYFNYSDCRESAALEPAMFWFAARQNRPSLLWAEVGKVRTCAEHPDEACASKLLNQRLLPLALLWSPPLRDVPAPSRLHWRGDGCNPIGVHRNGWDSSAVFVGLKGGSPACPHGHMDVGSFVLDALGVRWAVDLGLQEYATLDVGIWDKAQDSFRWKVFRLNNLSHNALVADGAAQPVHAGASIVSFGDDDDPLPHTILDMRQVYASMLQSAYRGVAMIGDNVLIRDALASAEARVTVRWGMVTRAAVTFTSDRDALLRQAGRSLTVRVLNPPDAAWRRYETETPPAAHDCPNPDTCMIGFETIVPAGRSSCIEVLLIPGEAAAAEPSATTLARIEAWRRSWPT